MHAGRCGRFPQGRGGPRLSKATSPGRVALSAGRSAPGGFIRMRLDRVDPEHGIRDSFIAPPDRKRSSAGSGLPGSSEHSDLPLTARFFPPESKLELQLGMRFPAGAEALPPGVRRPPAGSQRPGLGWRPVPVLCAAMGIAKASRARSGGCGCAGRRSGPEEKSPCFLSAAEYFYARLGREVGLRRVPVGNDRK